MRPVKLSDVRMAALFLVSICVLAFEIEVMRVFAVGSWSNFGSMVISIALLGFGVAGTILTFLGDRVRRNPDGWLAVTAFALGPSMAVAHAVAQHVPFNPVLIVSDPAQLWWIGVYYLVYGVPFFAGGLFIGVCFTAFSSPHAPALLLEHAGLRTGRSCHPRAHVRLSARTSSSFHWSVSQ